MTLEGVKALLHFLLSLFSALVCRFLFYCVGCVVLCCIALRSLVFIVLCCAVMMLLRAVVIMFWILKRCALKKYMQLFLSHCFTPVFSSSIYVIEIDQCRVLWCGILFSNVLPKRILWIIVICFHTSVLVPIFCVNSEQRNINKIATFLLSTWL